MSAFLLLGPPIFSLFYLTFFVPKDLIGATARSFLKGILVFIPAVFLFLLARSALESAQGSFLIYISFALTDCLLYPAAAGGGFALFYKYRESPGSRRFLLTSFFSGVFCLTGLVNIVADSGRTDPYIFFFLPLIRIGITALLPLLIDTALEEYGFLRLLLFIAAPLFGCVSALVGFFLDQNFLLLALALQTLTSGLAAFFFFRSRALPKSPAENYPPRSDANLGT